MIIDFGKANKGKELSECDSKYLQWLVSHEKVLAKRNRWASRDAKIILERRAQAAAQAEAVKAYEAKREAEMVAKARAWNTAEMARRAEKKADELFKKSADLGLKGNLNTGRAFSLLR